MDLSFHDFTSGNFIVPIITFIGGFLLSRFTLTKKDRKDIEQKMFENGRQLVDAQKDRFQDFSGVLRKYIQKEGTPDFNDFFEISTAGERYFYQQKITSDAILSDKVDRNSRDNTLLPNIIDTVKVSLPSYYRALQNISKKYDIPYDGKLEVKNYKSLYLVIEKYGDTEDL